MKTNQKRLLLLCCYSIIAFVARSQIVVETFENTDWSGATTVSTLTGTNTASLSTAVASVTVTKNITATSSATNQTITSLSTNVASVSAITTLVAPTKTGSNTWYGSAVFTSTSTGRIHSKQTVLGMRFNTSCIVSPIFENGIAYMSFWAMPGGNGASNSQFFIGARTDFAGTKSNIPSPMALGTQTTNTGGPISSNAQVLFPLNKSYYTFNSSGTYITNGNTSTSYASSTLQQYTYSYSATGPVQLIIVNNFQSNIFLDDIVIYERSYHNKANSDVTNLSNWGLNADGNGPASPDSFSTTNNFNVTNSGAFMGSDWTVSNLNLPNNLSIGSNTLTLNGALTGNGSLTGSATSNLIIGGTAGTVKFTSGNRLLKNLTLNDNASATLGTPLDITGGSSAGVLTVGSGATLNTGDNLTLKSDANGTARLGTIAGTINGNATVERFIGIPTAKRAWRMLTVPLRSTTTDVSIFDTWQEGGAQITGYGTLVTGANANTSTNGLDVTSGASMRSFVNGAWVDVTNTKTTPLFTASTSAANRSFAVFVRGDRSSLTSTSAQSTTVLRATGALQTGRQSFEVANNSSFTLLGNPYASPIDFNKFYLSNPDTIARELHYWDADRSNDGTGAGGYVTALWDGSTYDYTPNGAPRKTTIIQSGMAFFVKTNGSFAATPTVSFLESQKDVAAHNVFRTGSQNEKLYVDLFLQSTTGNTWSLADGFLARYHNSYNMAVINGEDAGKMLNTTENFSLKRNGNLLAIESRPLVDADDTLFVSMSNIKQNRSYKFAFDPQNFDAPGLSAYLEDAFLNNATPVSLSAPTEIVFTTTTAAGSFAADRFRIVFKASSTLSTSGLTVKASLVEKQVRIDWSMVNENNVKGYTVERSSDGKTFTALTAVNAKANDNSTVSYDATDASPLNGINYYRIKATDVNGKITYSAIVRIKTNDTKASVTVYPNPVKGEQLNIQLNGLSKGTYTLRLYNNLGQEVYGSTLQVTQAAMSQTLNIAALKTSGVYTLRITNGDQTIEQTIVAQ